METCLQAARARDVLPDLINMAIEELILNICGPS